MNGPSAAPPLQSWKEIAAFLGVSVRTAQYWETEKGLPVRRLPGEKARVFASPDELAHWRTRAGISARPFEAALFWRTYAVAATLALILAAGHDLLQYINNRSGPPVAFRAEPDRLTAVDVHGRIVWTRAFEKPADPGSTVRDRLFPRRRLWFGDLDGDKGMDAVYLYLPLNGGTNPPMVICFTRDGRERWRYALGPVDRNQTLDGGVVTDLEVLPASRHPPAVFVGTCSWPRHGGRILVLNRDGKKVEHLDLPGHLELLQVRELDADGQRELLVGGFDSRSGNALLMIVNTRNMKVDASVVFPRSCINRVLGESNRVYRLAGNENFLEIGLEEWIEDTPVERTIRLDRSLSWQSVSFSGSFRRLHKRLELEGQLRHSLQHDERTSRDIVVWRSPDSSP